MFHWQQLWVANQHRIVGVYCASYTWCGTNSWHHPAFWCHIMLTWQLVALVYRYLQNAPLVATLKISHSQNSSGWRDFLWRRNISSWPVAGSTSDSSPSLVWIDLECPFHLQTSSKWQGFPLWLWSVKHKSPQCKEIPKSMFCVNGYCWCWSYKIEWIPANLGCSEIGLKCTKPLTSRDLFNGKPISLFFQMKIFGSWSFRDGLIFPLMWFNDRENFVLIWWVIFCVFFFLFVFFCKIVFPLKCRRVFRTVLVVRIHLDSVKTWLLINLGFTVPFTESFGREMRFE